MRLVKFCIAVVIMVVIAVIAAVFVADNPVSINVGFYHWQLSDISLPLFTLFVFSIGLLLGILATGMQIIAIQSRLTLIRRQLKAIKKERDKLRLVGSKND